MAGARARTKTRGSEWLGLELELGLRLGLVARASG